MKRIIACGLGMILLASTLATPLLAAEPAGPSPDEIAADLLFIRPVAFSSIVLGTAIFVVSLPFTAPTRNIGLAWKKLVVAPSKYTFSRPLGQLETNF